MPHSTASQVPRPIKSPSNREGFASLGEDPVPVGLDRISLSFPCDQVEQDLSQWDRVVVENRLSESFDEDSRDSVSTYSSRVLMAPGVFGFVSCREVPENGEARWWGKVECNPSRISDPEGVGLVGVEDLPVALVACELAAQSCMDPAVAVDDWRVKRVDIARDFEGVEDPGRLIRGLVAIHRPHSRQNMVYADPKANRAETLMVGNATGRTRLYNKHVESCGRAEEGTVRWETEARRDWLHRLAGIHRVDDLSSEKLSQLARNRWEWSAMGVEVASSVGRLVRVVQAADLTERECLFFLGWLMCEAAGQSPRELGSATVAKYRKLQRELGIAAPSDFEGMVEVLSRLDWDSGREVLRVA